MPLTLVHPSAMLACKGGVDFSLRCSGVSVQGRQKVFPFRHCHTLFIMNLI